MQLYEHIEKFYRGEFEEVMGAVKDKLYETIIQLDSDQALKHLALDESLSAFKNDRIRQIVQEAFSLSGLVQELSSELIRYKSECLKLQVEFSFREKQQMSALEEVEKRFSEYKRQVQSQKGSLSNSKTDNVEHAEQVDSYRVAMRAMQADLQKVKNQWEKRCQEVQREAFEEAKVLIQEARREAQDKLDIWLQHISRQEGPLVVREDLNMIDQLKDHHNRQLKQMKTAHTHQTQQLQLTISQMKSSENRLKEQLRQSSLMAHELSKSQLQKEQGHTQENRLLKSQIQSIVAKHQESIKDKMDGEKKLVAESEELKARLGDVNKSITGKEFQIGVMKEKINNLEDALRGYKDTKHQLSQQLSLKDSKNTELESRIITDKQKEKKQRQKHRQSVLKLDGLRLQLGRLKSQVSMESDQIKYELDCFKRKVQTVVNQTTGEVTLGLQKIQMKYDNKLNNVIHQFQASQKSQNCALEEALKENQYLRGQLRDCEDAFESKLSELRKQRQQPRIDVEREIEELRKTIIKMVKSSYNQQQDVHEKIRQEIHYRDTLIQELQQQISTLDQRNNQLAKRFQKVEGVASQNQRDKRMAEKELKNTRAQLLMKETMIHEYSKQHKQKQNVRGNRPDKEKDLEEIRAMIVKTYEAVGSQPPQRHRRKADR